MQLDKKVIGHEFEAFSTTVGSARLGAFLPATFASVWMISRIVAICPPRT